MPAHPGVHLPWHCGRGRLSGDLRKERPWCRRSGRCPGNHPMNHSIHVLDRLFYFATPILFLTAIVLWAVMLCSALAARRPRSPATPAEFWTPCASRCALAFVGIIASFFVVGDIVQWTALNE